MALLTGRQSFFIDKMSQMLIRESSDSEETSHEEEDQYEWGKEYARYAEKLAKSKERVD